MFNPQEKEEYWISISDMMTGLMLIFLFIAITYMSKISDENEKFLNIVNAYQTIQDKIFENLYSEFKEDLFLWGGSIDRETLSISFNEPEILFDKGKQTIKPMFKAILEDFYPRYIRILSKEEFQKNIQSLRIEGHTSSEWQNNTNLNQSYINNMVLSQNRTSSVLNFILNLDELYQNDLKWAKNKIISVGFSSSKLKYEISNSDNKKYEDKARSRRVEFRIITNAEEKINEILEINEKNNFQINTDLDQNKIKIKSENLMKRKKEIEIEESKNNNPTIDRNFEPTFQEKEKKEEKEKKQENRKNFLRRLFGV